VATKNGWSLVLITTKGKILISDKNAEMHALQLRLKFGVPEVPREIPEFGRAKTKSD
jgi:hypothetical protein